MRKTLYIYIHVVHTTAAVQLINTIVLTQMGIFSTVHLIRNYKVISSLGANDCSARVLFISSLSTKTMHG